MNKQIIYQDFIDNKTKIAHLAKKYNVNRKQIYIMLKTFGVNFKPRYKPNYKYQVNENYFDVIDTKDKAYFLGLLAADGSYSIEGYLTLGLSEEDSHIINSFKTYIGSSYPIKIDDRSHYKLKYNSKGDYQNKVYTRITNPKFTKNLNDLGIHFNKEFTVFVPKLNNELYSHYIRGVFDGDGGVYLSNNEKSFSCYFFGHNSFIIDIKKLLEDLGGLYGGYLQNIALKNNTEIGTTLFYGGRRQIKVLHDFIYNDSDETIQLKRKYDKIKKIIDAAC